MRTRSIALVAILSLLWLAGCGDDDEESPAAAGTETDAGTTAQAGAETAPGSKPAPSGEETEPLVDTTKPPPDPDAATTIIVAGSEFGNVLFDSHNQAIYLFDKETSPKSQCYGACAKAWPPVLTKAFPQAGPGLKADKLGTMKRTDGTTQVTYGGHPLYYYAHEEPGEVLCHDVEEFGGLWLVIQPNGDPAPS